MKATQQPPTPIVAQLIEMGFPRKKVEFAIKAMGEWKNVNYRQVSNIRCTLVGNEIVDHSDVVGASPVGAAPTTSSFST